MMVQTARVALENASLQYDRLYSYRVPEGMPLLAGCRVTVPFGAGNRTRLGIAMEVSQEEGEGLKSLSSVVDTAPLLNGELLGLARWLRENTFCCYYDAVRTLLPPGMGVDLRYTYELSKEPQEALTLEGDQKRIMEYLQGRGKPVREETLLAA